MDADAMSTMMFVAGTDVGLECTSEHDIAGVVLVDEEMRVWVSRSLQRHFTAVSGLKVHTI